MIEHTNEPWRCMSQSWAHGCDARRWSILPPVARGDDHITPRTIAELPPPTAECDARRIVACVNALAGLNPGHVGELVEMCDELRRALAFIHKWTTDDNCAMCVLLTKAHALLAKVKVEK